MEVRGNRSVRVNILARKAHRIWSVLKKNLEQYHILNKSPYNTQNRNAVPQSQKATAFLMHEQWESDNDNGK